LELHSKRLKIRSLLRPHWKALTIAMIAVIGQAIASLAEPWPIKVVVDYVLQSKSIPGWLNPLVAPFGEDKLAILRFAAGAALLVAVFDAICSYTEKVLTTSVGQWIMHELRRTLYSHIQRLSLSYHDQKRTGDLISRATGDIDAVQTFITSGLLSTFVNVLTLVGMIGVMFYLDWRFTLVALSVAPILGAVVLWYTRRIKKAARDVRKKEGEILSVMQEVLSSIRVVKAFAREDYEQKRLEEESMEGVEIALRARSLKAKLAPIVGVIVAVGTSLVLWFGARLVLSGTLSAGSLILFIMYLRKMYKPMQELSKVTDTYSKATVGYERIHEILEMENEVKDRRNAKDAPRFAGRIEFDHVSFSYDPQKKILKDVSFVIEPGQRVAIVGPTGSGKSTIISLIPRFYDPTEGIVKLDGFDIRDFKQRSIRRQISFVLQDTLLFHGTIWSNIAYGKPDANRSEIVHAAEVANAAEFIDKLPNGYDTIIGERGVTLSGGQRQRIAIARAVIRNTPILMLDEPSSGLDAASEQVVFDALNKLMEGKTSVVIAHRLSTIQSADIIFVIKEGVLVERGKHDELLKAGGVYAEFHDLQFRSGDVAHAAHPVTTADAL
jgi:ATP-binding cassette subfamily B protein